MILRLAAVAVAGLLVFAGLGLALTAPGSALPGDEAAADLAAALRARAAEEVVARLTDLGSLPVVALACAASALVARRRGRPVAAVTLAAGIAVTWVAVHLAKAAEARPRPPDPFTQTFGLSYPSGHAAYAVGLVVCAGVLARRRRALVVGAAVAVAAFVGASRIYLRVHYLSDVVGGFAIAAAAFALSALAAGAVGRLRHNGTRP